MPLRTFEPHPTDRAEHLRGTPLASFGRRAAALAIDFFLAGVTFVGLAVLGILALAQLGWLDEEGDYLVHFKFFGNWYSVLWSVFYLGLSNHLGDGATTGKRWLGIRAVSLSHARLRGWQAFERALGYGASALELGFGFVQYFFNRNRQTVHDRIAETIVIDERAARRLREAAKAAAAAAPAA